MSKGCDGVTGLGDIGHIQRCGYLLAFEEDTHCSSGMRIVGSSENIMEAPWIDASSTADILGKDFGVVFPAECVDIVRCLVGREKETGQPRDDLMTARANRNTADFSHFIPRAQFQLGSKDKTEIVTLTLASSNPGVYLLEQELKDGHHSKQGRRTPGLLQVADLLGYIPIGSNPTASTAALCGALLEGMPAYDRFMVYRFDKSDGCGEVIHEEIRPGSGIESSYLGFRFPAADIPPMARSLFKLLGARFIADTIAPGVPVSLHSERLHSLDLSKSALRAPADCHLRYLRNMGVRASMVVAIVVDAELWGLYILHSCTKPVHPSCEERIMVEMAAMITASLISRHQREEIATTALSLSHVMGKLNHYTRVTDFLSGEHTDLLRILDVDAIVFCERSQSITAFGDKKVALTLEECNELVNRDDVSDSALLFKQLGARGVVFFSVRYFRVAFVRGSVARQVKWAGKPDEPRDAEEPMGPRASFELFMETAAGMFKAWSLPTVGLLKMVRQAFFSQLYAEALPGDLQEAFAHVSHELRTPFHGVMGALEILEAGTGAMGDHEQRGIIRSALRCGHSMMSTLDAILDIAKDRNNTEVLQERFAAAGPILTTIAAMSPFAATESVTLIADVGPAKSVLDVIGDKRRIKGIVQNLVNNAIKFTPTGGKVRVFLAVHDTFEDVMSWWKEEAARFDGNVWLDSTSKSAPAVGEGPYEAAKWYVYCVEDSGVGVQPADLPKLGAAYRQISQGASKSYSGTGLGLHICKTHLDAMHGVLGIASTFSGGPGGRKGGTLFAVALPLRPATEADAGAVGGDDDDDDHADNGGVQPAPATASATLSGCNIGCRKIAFLVVDDHKVNVKLLEHKIKQHFKGSGADVEVLTATSGFMALDVHAAARSIHLDPSVLAGVFIDFNMPDLDGIECTRRIRLLEADNGWPTITICGCTGDMSQSVRLAFLDAGGNEIACKPWHSGRIEGVCNKMVETALGMRPSGPAAG